uniref:Diuretic hormone n=1 Tax=Bactrocera dorsalis TaxID=27457 RepID=A0A034UWZ1_BACDO
MKAATRLCPIIVLICAARLVCTAQQRYHHSSIVGYPLDYADVKLIQKDFSLDKRNKPSLSIVNPLDVLRQRLLLEIARRQMKENTRQVELNRAILKNVGKRMLNNDGDSSYKLPLQEQQQFEYSLKHIPYPQQMYTYRAPQYDQQSQFQLQPLWQPHYTNQLEYTPDVSIYDYLHEPAHIYNTVLGATESKGNLDGQTTSWYIDALENGAEEGDANIYNTKGNELTSERRIQDKGTGGDSSSTNVDSFPSGGTLSKNVSDKVHLAALEDNVLANGADKERNVDNADYHLRYFYGVPKKHHNMKK